MPISKPKPNEDLAEIVRRGASRPLRKWLFITLATAAIAGGVIYYFSRKQEGPEKTEYLTQPARIDGISLIVTAAGNLAPTNQVIIGSELSGTAQEVYVDTNDLVKQGQPLAKLDTSKLSQQTERSRASLLSAKAKVSQARATLEESKAALTRQEELLSLSGGKTPSRATMETSRATVSRAEADLENALAAVAGAEAEVRSFERDLEKAIIRSPVDGVVLARSIEVGPDRRRLVHRAHALHHRRGSQENGAARQRCRGGHRPRRVGQTATFSVDAWPSRTYSAKVKKVAFGAANTGTANGAGNAATTGVVNYSTELEVANDDLSLRPGMTATVDISIVEKQDILVVPNSALRFDPVAAAAIGKPDETKRTLVQSLSPGGGRRWRGTPGPKINASPANGPRVWTLKDGEPVEIPVTTGITDGRVTEITGDSLAPETPVIISIKPAKPA